MALLYNAKHHKLKKEINTYTNKSRAVKGNKIGLQNNSVSNH